MFTEITIFKTNKKFKYCPFYNKIEENLFGGTVSRVISMCLWLHVHVQSAINMDVVTWMYRYYIVDMLNIFI